MDSSRITGSSTARHLDDLHEGADAGQAEHQHDDVGQPSALAMNQNMSGWSTISTGPGFRPWKYSARS